MGTSVIGALRVVLGLDSAAFDSGLSAAQRKLRQTGKELKNIGAGFAKVGQNLTLGITAPLALVATAMVRSASAAEEMQSAFRVSFGSMADATENWAETTGNALGRSTYELQAAASAFNGLFKAGGPANEQATALSKTFAVLAQDLASFHDLSPEDAMAALRSGLSGEAEPLRRFNVFLTEGAVKAEAYALGLAVVGAELTEQAKIQARASLILKGTTEAQGDVARTSDSTANRLRELRASWEELSVTLGQKILPVFTPVVAALSQLAQSFTTLPSGVQTAILVFGAAAAAIGPLLVAIGAVVSAVGTLTAALGAGGVAAGLGAFLAPLLPILGPIALGVAAVVAAFLLFRDDVEPVLRDLFQTANEVLGPALRDLFSAIGELVGSIAALFKNALESEAGQALIRFQMLYLKVLGTTLIQVLRVVIDTVTFLVRSVSDGFRVLGALLRGDFSGAWEAYKAGAQRALAGVLAACDRLVPGATDAMRRLYIGVREWLETKMGQVFDGVGRKVKEVGDFFLNLWDRVVGHSYIPDMVEGIAAWMAKLDAGMVTPARNATEATRKAFEDLRSDVERVMEGLLTDSERAARDLANTLSVLDQARAQGLISEGEYQQARTRATTETLSPAENQVGALEPLRILDLGPTEEQLRRMADEFGDRFANGIEAALSGDLRGVLEVIFGDLRSSLRDLGRELFAAFGGGTGGGSGLGGIGAFFSRLFSGLPKFANGGSILPGGSGGTDSQLVAFWKSPHERVDIGAPGFDRSSGSPVHFDLRGAVMTADLLAQMQTMASASGGAAVRGARETVPSDMARSSRYALGRG